MTNENLQTIKTEEVKFYEDILLGGKDDQGNIWLAVNKTCISLGLSEGQMKSQRKIIKDDLVLSQGGRNFILPTNGGEQELIMISEKFIPLWLAKISITPKMKQENPELVDKLVRYQLECADVLHNHFMGTQEKKEQFFNDTLNIDIKSIMEQNEFLITENKEIKEELRVIHSEFEGFKLFNEQQNQILYTLVQRFNIYDNPSVSYTRLVDDFNTKVYGVIKDRNKHKMFWEGICNWIGIDINDLYKQSNKKQWLLDNLGIEILNYFVDNVILGRIKQNTKGNWINLNGYNSDPYEIEKNKIRKHWTTKDGKLRCCYCGQSIENPKENDNYNFEHYTAKTSSGSTNTIENLGIACCDCNKDKNILSYDEFVKVKNTEEIYVKRKLQWDNLYK